MAGFVGVALAALAILWPRRWEITANPRGTIRTYIEASEPVSADEAHRDLALHMHLSFIKNERGLTQFIVLFQVAGFLLTVEVLLWIIAITSTG